MPNKDMLEKQAEYMEHQGDIFIENGNLYIGRQWYKKAIKFRRENNIPGDQPEYMNIIDAYILAERD